MANVCMRCNSATTTRTLYVNGRQSIELLQWVTTCICVTHAYAYLFSPILNLFYLYLCHYRKYMYIFPIKCENINDKI